MLQAFAAIDGSCNAAGIGLRIGLVSTRGVPMGLPFPNFPLGEGNSPDDGGPEPSPWADPVTRLLAVLFALVCLVLLARAALFIIS